MLALTLMACSDKADDCQLPCVNENTATTDIYRYWGIRDAVIRQTAAGYMLDFRFHVTDVEKSKKLFDRKIFPVVIRESDQSRYMVPASEKLGVLRQAPRFVKEGRQYFIYFANPGKRIAKGEKVTVTIGDFVLPHLVVE